MNEACPREDVQDNVINLQHALGTLCCLTVRGPRDYQALLTRRPTLHGFSIHQWLSLEWAVLPILEPTASSLLSTLPTLAPRPPEES